MKTQQQTGCACGCESAEEELLVQLARRRQLWDEEWRQRGPEEQERDAERHAKSIAHNDRLICQVQERLARRLEAEAEPPSA